MRKKAVMALFGLGGSEEEGSNGTISLRADCLWR